jgi:hypothetical protein
MFLCKCRSFKSYRKENYEMTQNEVFQPGSRKHGEERRNQKGKIVGRKKRLQTFYPLASIKHKLYQKIIKAMHGMVTYIMQGIGCSIHQLTYQTFNAKCKIVILVFSEPLSIQNKMYDAGTNCWCEELFGMYVKTANKNIHSSSPQATENRDMTFCAVM